MIILFVIMTVLGTLSIYSILLPLLIGLVFLRSLSKDSLIVWGIVLAGTIPQLMKAYFDGIQILFAFEKKQFLNVAYNIYILVEFLLIFFLFRGKFYQKLSNLIFNVTVFIYTVLSVSIIFFNGITQRFLNELISVNSLIYTAWILIIVLEQYSVETKLNITPVLPIFWFLAGMFLYASCTIMSFLFWPSSQQKTTYISDVLKAIHAIFNITLYVFFSIGLLKEILVKKYLSSKETKLKKFP